MVYTHHISHTYPHLHHHRRVGMIRSSILPGERHSELNQDNSLLSLLPCTLILITTYIVAIFITTFIVALGRLA